MHIKQTVREFLNITSKKDILIIIILFCVAFLIRKDGVSNVVILWDEWDYWSKTFEILANDWYPTTKLFTGPSPFLSYLGAAVTLLFDGDLNTLRMISVIFGSLTVPLLYLFGKAMYNSKVGLLSALFLCFSAYHIVYSRVIMLEVFTLFFVTAFLYFFWLSQRYENERKSTIYIIVAGSMMGLAIAAKYLPAFFVPAIFMYILWIKKFSFKALIDKKIFLMLIFAFLFFSPLLIGFAIMSQNPIDFYYSSKFSEIGTQTERDIAMFEYGVGGGKTMGLDIPLSMLFTRGLEKITEVLAWGADIFTPMWTTLFEVSAILLFLTTLLFHLQGFINGEKESGFLIILICILYMTIVLLTTVAKYYLIYSFPLYFVMLSHMAIESFNHLIKERSYKNIFRNIVVSLTAIMLFFYLITGATSSFWDEGEELTWVKSAAEFIKSDITNSNYEKPIFIGLAAGSPAKINYIFDDANLNVSTIRIGERARIPIDLEMINRLRPSYLVVSEVQYHNLFKTEVKEEIFKDYLIVFHSETHYPYDGFVFKRVNNMRPVESTSPADGKEGTVNQDIFKRSVPSVMKVGNAYTVLVQIKNTGNYQRTFTVKVYSEGGAIFIDNSYRRITMDEGSTRILKFKIVPIKEHVGKLPIVADLYVENKKVDYVSDDIVLIKK